MERMRRILGSSHEDIKGFNEYDLERPSDDVKADLVKFLQKYQHAHQNRAERRLELGIDHQEMDLHLKEYTKIFKGLSKGLAKPFNFLQNDNSNNELQRKQTLLTNKS